MQKLESLTRRYSQLFKGGGVGSLLLRVSSGGIAIKVGGAGIAFLIQIWLARLLGASNYGIYIFVLAWINFLGLFAKAGMDVTLVRFIPIYQSKAQWAQFKGLLRYCFKQATFLSVLLGLGVTITVYFLKPKIGVLQTHSFWVAALLLPVLALTAMRGAALQGMKYAILAQIPEQIMRPLMLGIFAGAVFLYQHSNFDAVSALSANVAAAAIAFYIGTRWLLRRLPAELKHVEPEYQRQEWLRMALPMLFIAGMHLLLHQTDVMMLGFLSDAENTGVYGAAVRISTLVTFGLTSVNAIVAPLISEYYAKDHIRELQRLITLAARGIFIFTAVVSLVLVIFGSSILGLFGPEFTQGFSALWILLIGQVISALAGSVGFLMVMTGHQLNAAKIIGGSAALNIVLNAILIPTYGIKGAAIATMISTALWNFLMLFFVKRNININPTIFARIKS